MTSISDLHAAVDALRADCYEFADREAIGVPALAGEILWVAHNDREALTPPAAAAYARMEAAREEAASIREAAFLMVDEAAEVVANYRTAIVAGAADPALLPKEVPLIDVFSVRLEAMRVQIETQRQNLIAAILELNGLATEARHIALAGSRKRYREAVTRYREAALVIQAAYDDMKHAELTVRSFDPIDAERLEVITRTFQDLNFLYRVRRDVELGLKSLGAAVMTPNAVTIFCTDTWAMADPHLALALQTRMPVPAPVAIETEPEPDVVSVSDLDRPEVDLTPKPRARRKAETVTV